MLQGHPSAESHIQDEDKNEGSRALERAQRVLGTKVAGPDKEGFYRIEKGGREAYRILSRIPRSAERARKDEICLNRCRAL